MRVYNLGDLLGRTPPGAVAYAGHQTLHAQARAFELKPAGLVALLDMIVHGSYQDHAAVQATVVAVFSQFEAIFEALGLELYDSTIDPN